MNLPSESFNNSDPLIPIDKEGQIVFSTGKTADQYRSEASFMMVGGAKAIDKEMMKYQMDALSVSAKAVAEKAGK